MSRLHRIFYDKKHNTDSIFKVGDKVLKSNARNSHRMGGKQVKPWLIPYIINQDLGKGRYYVKRLKGKALKQTFHCARLKHSTHLRSGTRVLINLLNEFCR